MAKFPVQSLLAALLLLALAFSVHDRSAAQAPDKTRVSLQLACEFNYYQEFDQLRPAAGPNLNCAPKLAKK